MLSRPKNRLTESIIKNTLNEDFWNPGKYFLALQDMEDIDSEKWNKASQEERDAMVRPFLQAFWDKYKTKMTWDDVHALFDDMEDSNYHTEGRVLEDIINKDSYKINEAVNPENEEKNKIIRNALKGPKSMRKNKEALKKMGITASDLNYDYDKYGDESDLNYGSTIYLHGPNGKQLSVDPDGTNVWHTGGSSEKHYKKELEFKNRHSKNYNNMDRLDFTGNKAKAFDYYNYLTKPKNEYQDEVDDANDVKSYRENKKKTGYNLPDEALTPEEKSLNIRPRKYLQLKKDRDKLETELSGYNETKKKLDKTNKEIKKLHDKKEINSELKESENDLNHDAGYLIDKKNCEKYLKNLKSILEYNSDQYVAEIENLDKGGKCRITIDYYMLVALCKMYEERIKELSNK